MQTLFYKFWRNVCGSFAGRNLLFHLGAIISTYLIVVSGFDWFYFKAAESPSLHTILFPAVLLGAILPIIVPACIYALGEAFKSRRTRIVAFTLVQAEFIAYLVSTAYKAFTGRIQPDLANTLTDISHGFQFGFLRHGIFWGWPSSHTAVAFAGVMALIFLFPKSKLVKFLGLLYAFYIGLGISVSIHWFSEFLAGALIGTVIGKTVGKSFREILQDK